MNRVVVGVVALCVVVSAHAFAAGAEFKAAGQMTTDRQAHTATVLANGKVLIVGGFGSAGLAPSAEIYDPSSGTFTRVDPPPSGSHYQATATLLLDGTVLIAGGQESSTAEIYDPILNRFTSSVSLTRERKQSAATRLLDGRVLITGGWNSGQPGAGLASAEIYDPVSQVSSAIADMATGRYEHTSTLLADGRVLIAGGVSLGAARNSAEIFDPATDAFTLLPNQMSSGRTSHTASLLPDGRVLIAGGSSGGLGWLATAETFAPGADAFTLSANAMAEARAFHVATTLADGSVLITGGASGAGGVSASDARSLAERFDPGANTFSPASTLISARYVHTASALADGRVLIAGGLALQQAAALADVELFRPSAYPVAVPGTYQTVRPGTQVTLNGLGSFDDNTATNLLTYSWSLASAPAGAAATLSGASTATPFFTPDILGTYVISLVVSDQDGLRSAPVSLSIAQNPQPSADAGLDQIAVTSHVVTISGSGVDADGDTLVYDWSVVSRPRGSNGDLFDPSSPTTTFIPDAPGLYVLRLSVSDALGAGVPDDTEVTVIAAASYAEVQVQAAATAVAVLPGSDVTNSGNQNALMQYFSHAVAALQSDDTVRALQQLQLALLRTDGCARRGAPDGNGQGRDWITTCEAQQGLYPLLAAAIDAIAP